MKSLNDIALGVYLVHKKDDRPVMTYLGGEKEWAALKDQVEVGEGEASTYYPSMSIMKRLLQLLTRRKNNEMTAIAQLKAFREDVMVWMRAVEMSVSAALDGGTHREKDARLRGAVSVIESAVGKIRNAQNKEYSGWWREVPNVFQSDFPTRHLLDRIHELEGELRSLNPEHPLANQPNNGDDVIF